MLEVGVSSSPGRASAPRTKAKQQPEFDFSSGPLLHVIPKQKNPVHQERLLPIPFLILCYCKFNIFVSHKMQFEDITLRAPNLLWTLKD